MPNYLNSDIEKLMKKLESVVDNSKKESKAALRQGAKVYIQNIQQRAPVKTGNLRESVKILFFRRSPAVFAGVATGKKAGRADGYYAHWVEYGVPSKKFPPNPFFRAGVAASGTLPAEIAVAILKKKIEQHVKKISKV